MINVQKNDIKTGNNSLYENICKFTSYIMVHLPKIRVCKSLVNQEFANHVFFLAKHSIEILI
jgi:hypothetical protein